jgi:hypothetical protein
MSKFLNSCILTILTLVSISASANGIPLQQGFYNSGSRYIEIATDGERFCYQGISNHGVTTASLYPDGTVPDRYRIYQFDGVTIQQVNSTTLAVQDEYGSFEYEQLTTSSDDII